MAVFRRQLPVPVKASLITEHIVCQLCCGYIIDATVVVECLHTFCRSCIVKHVKRPEKRHRCPVCNVLIGEAQPLAGLRLDRTLQDIIDKLLPQVRENEEQKEEIFNATRNVENTASAPIKPSLSRSSPVERLLPPVTEEKITLYIKPSQLQQSADLDKRMPEFTSYLRCSSHMTVLHLKRFVVEKTGSSCDDKERLDILCRGNVLRNELTLEFIWRIRWGDLSSLLVLEYTYTDKDPNEDSEMLATTTTSAKDIRKRRRRKRGGYAVKKMARQVEENREEEKQSDRDAEHVVNKMATAQSSASSSS
ncbi:polycomb group RING finger protein 1-like [Corticium candelabrum]|uniref:polycomb group RING finger protein 1-like n=1 Tax=Corticium candelabrum TaxID=121492 RepID=UPI002E2660C0|nr:polycomb group RING finger protein 1-like [Corticium candelabrum]